MTCAVVTDACSVPVSEIITVEETDSQGKPYGSGKWQKMEKPYAFTVHRVRRARHHRWRHAQVTFRCADEQLCLLWLRTLREQLEKLSTCLRSRRDGQGAAVPVRVHTCAWERVCARVLACACVCTRGCACCCNLGFRPPSHSSGPGVGGTSQ